VKIFKIFLATLLAVIAALSVLAYWQINQLEVEEITPDLHVIYGLGGNVAVLRTGAGTVIVDTMTFKMQGDLIRDKAQALTGEPVAVVINTHYHSDHTHGNPAFPADTRVIATERTLHHLNTTDADYFSDRDAALLPNETIESREMIRIGNKTLHLIHPGRGHTDGDLVVLFQEDQTVHLGDLFFNHLYPNIDLEGGGSVQAWGDSLDQILILSFDKLIPGHGSLAIREDLQQFQRFIRQLATLSKKAATDNLPLETFLANSGLTEDEGYNEVHMVIPIGLNRSFVLRRGWEEATGNYHPRD